MNHWMLKTLAVGGTIMALVLGHSMSVAQQKGFSPIERLCADKGLRMTDQRRVIAQVIESAADHPDVEELYRRASAQDARISLSTVYRTLNLFEEAGLVTKHDFKDGRARFEPIPDEHHDHLIDIRSGKVIEFRNEEIEAIQELIAKRLGYRLVDHRLELYAVPLKSEPQK